jgi:hypothetical protein
LNPFLRPEVGAFVLTEVDLVGLVTLIAFATLLSLGVLAVAVLFTFSI